MKNKLLIYGASGYTAKLFARRLTSRGFKPILAGRSKSVTATGECLDCETRIFPVEEAARHLDDVAVLVNLAGPFALTLDPLIEACLETGTHYMDIAGEVPELERAFSYGERAREKGVVLLPAAGFGVAPTDIAAKLASQHLENATHLRIVYATEGGASRGTLKTILQDIDKPGVELRNGAFEKVLPASKSAVLEAGGKTFKAVYNPWRADLFTAQQSTGIANVETYSVFPAVIVHMMKGRLGWLRNFLLNHAIRWMPEGPSEKQLEKGKTFVLAEATASDGRSARVEIIGPEAYAFTVACLDQLGKKLLSGVPLAGALTPSAFGTDWITNIKGVTIKS